MARISSNPNKIGPWIVSEDLRETEGYAIWMNEETGAEVKLAGSFKPTKPVLDTLALNSAAPEKRNSDDFDDEPEVEESPVSRILTALGTGDTNARAEVKIYRQLEPSGERYCGMFTPEQFETGNIELIRKSWGGGKYRVTVYGTTPKIDAMGNPIKHGGKFIKLGSTIIEIEEMRIEAAAAGTGNDGIVQVLSQMNNRINEMQRVPAGPNVSSDFLQQMEQFARLQKIFGGETKQQSVVQQIAEMEAMLGLRKRLAAERDGGNEDREKSLLDVASEFLPVLKEALIRPSAPASSAPVLAIPPSFAAAPPPAIEPPQPNPIPETQPVENDEMKAGELFGANVLLGAILSAAARGDDVSKHAPGLADKLPDSVADILETELWFDTLVEMFPARAEALTANREWLSKLRDAIIELLYEEGEEKPEPS